jgi:hypothetical protein
MEAGVCDALRARRPRPRRGIALADICHDGYYFKVSGIAEQDKAHRRFGPVYFTGLTVEGVHCFGPEQRLNLSIESWPTMCFGARCSQIPRSPRILGHLTSSVISHPRSSRILGHLASSVISHPRSSRILGHLASSSEDLGRTPAGLWTTGRPDDPRRSKPDRPRRGSQASAVPHSPDPRERVAGRVVFDPFDRIGLDRQRVALFQTIHSIVRSVDQTSRFILDTNPIDFLPHLAYTQTFLRTRSRRRWRRLTQ